MFRRLSNTKVFVATFAIFFLIFALRALFSHGGTLGHYFIAHDWDDTSMDFFNPLVFFGADDPYSTNSNYPALAACLFKAFRLFLPTDAPVDAAGLRTYLPAQVTYIIFILTCMLIVGYSVLTMLEREAKWKRVSLAVVVFLSGPLLFALERGNVIVLAFALTFLFFAEYKSKSTPIRWIAYCALAIAAGIKIYPCVFALLVARRDMKEFFGLCALIIAALILPFFFFDGFNSIQKMVDGFFMSSDEQLMRGLGRQYSLTFLIRDVAALAGVRLEEVPTIVQVAALLICLCTFAIARDEWARVFALSLACIWTPGFAATYSLVFLIPPCILFLSQDKDCDSESSNIWRYIVTVAFAILMAPHAFSIIQGGVDVAWPYAASPLTWGEIIAYAAMLFILITTIVQGVKQGIVSRSQFRKAAE